MKLIDIKNESQADPFIFEANGKFYVYATGRKGVALYRADDLFGKWESLGICAGIPGKKEFWAPSVIEIDGKYYMYVSCMNEGETDTHLQTMYFSPPTAPRDRSWTRKR